MASPMTSARTTLPAQRPATTSTTTTTVVTETSPAPIIIPSSGTLRLRGVRSPDRHIQWADDVIDNEGMGKKSSKVCCIYHKVRSPGESSSDESSDSSESDSDSEPDNSRARPVGGARRRPHRHHHHRRHNHDGGSNDEGDSEANGGNGSPKRRARRPSPNAYERMPKYGKKKADGSS